MTTQISVYAQAVVSRTDGNSQFVTLDEIDQSQVLGEFSEQERLESVELSVIHDYLKKVMEESDE